MSNGGKLSPALREVISKAERKYRVLSRTELFCEALDRYIQFGGRKLALDLYQACGAVWNETSQMPFKSRADVENAISNHIEFTQWEANGRTHSGAARRIRPVLRQEYFS